MKRDESPTTAGQSARVRRKIFHAPPVVRQRVAFVVYFVSVFTVQNNINRVDHTHAYVFYARVLYYYRVRDYFIIRSRKSSRICFPPRGVDIRIVYVYI